MIRAENRFDEYSYRVASVDLDPTATVEEGQFVTIKAGKLVLADKTSPKAFLAIGSNRKGRNQVAGKIVGKISFLVGDSVVSVSNFDATKVYTDDMTPLTVVAGNVCPVELATDLVVAYAIGKPQNGFLRIIVA